MTPLQQIHDIFSRRGFVWNFSDGRRVPTEEELNSTILNAIEALKPEADNTQLEVGRLIVRKSGSYYDVYVHLLEHKVELGE